MKSVLNSTLKMTAIILAITIFTATSFAQTNFTGGIHFNAGFPQGDLKDYIDNNAYGIDGQIFYSPQKSPFAIGLDLSWMNYGNTSRREPFSTTIPDVTVDVSTSNNIMQAFLVLRCKMPEGPIQLYGDALVGVNYMFTETKISDDGLFSKDVASSTNQDDAAFAYGFGGGLMVPVFTQNNDGKKPFQVLLDIGTKYIVGNEAEYLKEGSIRRENNKVTFDCIKSKTDMLKLHAGIMVKF